MYREEMPGTLFNNTVRCTCSVTTAGYTNAIIFGSGTGNIKYRIGDGNPSEVNGPAGALQRIATGTDLCGANGITSEGLIVTVSAYANSGFV